MFPEPINVPKGPGIFHFNGDNHPNKREVNFKQCIGSSDDH